ncbi:hypothetical protein DEU56DRAFT_912469 [Suillus clintonianus]|uniref:uncharacterized protein n=1 Tax=Suillus clintonianus TaxID=1904413 RepID=UPI001B864185|nr:uncharacterized protein DEU56DRAFT_912469 [Suillus clintonianus]KAG2138313.1 hypothetical protein DEU56DRAFT_912469 [Suillus clintonianus]
MAYQKDRIFKRVTVNDPMDQTRAAGGCLLDSFESLIRLCTVAFGVAVCGFKLQGVPGKSTFPEEAGGHFSHAGIWNQASWEDFVEYTKGPPGEYVDVTLVAQKEPSYQACNPLILGYAAALRGSRSSSPSASPVGSERSASATRGRITSMCHSLTSRASVQTRPPSSPSTNTRSLSPTPARPPSSDSQPSPLDHTMRYPSGRRSPSPGPTAQVQRPSSGLSGKFLTGPNHNCHTCSQKLKDSDDFISHAKKHIVVLPQRLWSSQTPGLAVCPKASWGSAAEVRFGPVLGGVLSNPELNLRSSSAQEANPGPDHS